MGFFSWITSDTGRSISNVYSSRGSFPVYLLCPDGTYFKEAAYEGYGCFGGRDAYALVAQWNCPERCKDSDGNWLSDLECRQIGIEIACHDENNAKLKYPLKFVEDYSLQYADVEPSRGCPDQGYFYLSDEEDEE